MANRWTLPLLAILAVAVAGGLYVRVIRPALEPSKTEDAQAKNAPSASQAAAGDPSVDLTASQVNELKIGIVAARTFTVTKETVGSIDFNQDRLAQVFTPYQGRIIDMFAQIGDTVTAGQPLFTVDSADLLQAEATLVQTAGVLDLTTATLARNQRLVPAGGGAQKDVEQAKSDQQTAEGNFKAARAALHIYGQDDSEIDRVVKERRVNSALIVRSPMNGVVTARNAAPGLFIQPGSAPAPYTVADLTTKWMNASVVEVESAQIKIGQQVQAKVSAFPDRMFDGRVTAIGVNVDPTIHRFLVRSEIKDPEQLLRPGMSASFTITTSAPFEAPAVPVNGIVREGDGTMSAWVTPDSRHFTRRTIQIGLQQDGFDEVRSGVKVGEQVVTDGAIFLSNMLESGSAAD